MDDMQEIMEDFFAEADESLDELEQDLIKLETVCDSGTFDGDLVDRIFRVLHTLKGGAGFLGLERMASLAHAGENLLDEVRGGSVPVSTDVMDALLKTNDLLKELLEIEKSGGDASTVETADVVATLEKLIGAEGEAPAEEAKPAEEAAPVEEAPAEEPVAAEATEAPAVEVNQDLLAEINADDRLAGPPVEDDAPVEEAPAVEVNQDLLAEINADDRLAGPPVEDDAPADEAPAVEVNQELLAEINADDRLAGPPVEDDAPAEETPAVEVNQELLAEINADDRLAGPPVEDDAPAEEEVKEETKAEESEAEVVEAEVVEPKPEPKTEAKPEQAKEDVVVKRGEAPNERRQGDRRKTERRAPVATEQTIRVETGKLDKTMNLVGELVLARNSLVRYLNLPDMKAVIDKAPHINEVMTNIEHLSQVTKDLQLSVLSTRMQPIKKVFDKIPRQVRDLKGKLDREVDLVIEGEFTEVDKSLVEELADPMVHLIRNSLDHGIEKPDDREAVGKKRTGTLKVSAFYEGNKVVIQVKDDGAGIDPEKVKGIAVKKGVISENDAENMNDEDAVRLIMAPGFSTAEVISDVSGRGVGMDVVNSSIQAIKGNIDIVSEFGVGTTINIYLPLTLAIVQALVVKAHHEGFAIPIGDINEVIKFNPADVHKMNDQDVIELRGQVLPLFYLSSITKDSHLPHYHTEVQEVDGHLETVIVPDAEGEVAEEVVAPAETEANTTQQDTNNTNGYVVVVRENKQMLGVVVHELIGQEEAVIKALASDFEYHSAISGATITGDGTVHMILDIPYLIKEMSKK